MKIAKTFYRIYIRDHGKIFEQRVKIFERAILCENLGEINSHIIASPCAIAKQIRYIIKGNGINKVGVIVEYVPSPKKISAISANSSRRIDQKIERKNNEKMEKLDANYYRR